MRASFVSFFVGGCLALSLFSCQQQQSPEALPEITMQTPNGERVKIVTKTRAGKSVVSRAVSSASSSAPSAASVAADSAAASRIVPVKPGLRVSRVQAPGMYVALTFDDGPSSAYTPKVLDILRRHGAHGTFFVLGNSARRCPSIVARAAAEGHEIGVHTWSHINMARSSTAKIDSEVSRTVDAIRSITGKTPAVMRPPYGATNAFIVNHMYNNYGMRSIMWDVDTRDWQRPGVSTVVSRAVNGAKPGSIILVHDIHASTLASIEGIVTGLQARGFKLVTVSELLARAGAHAAPRVPVAPAAAEPAAAPCSQVSPAPEAPQQPVNPILPPASAQPATAEPAPAPAEVPVAA